MGIFFNPEKYNIESKLPDEKIITTLNMDDEIQLDVSIVEKLPEKYFKNTTLAVYAEEGPFVPHFHVYRKKLSGADKRSKNKNFSACIKLESPEYFPHGEHKSILNNNQIEKLYEVLSSKKSDTGLTVWEECVRVWNEAQPEKYHVKTKTMPNYLELKR